MRRRNTLQKGSIRYIVFREGDAWYGAALEFNIVESGSTPGEAFILLSEAVQGYLESAKKIKARPNILNQKSDAEYEEMWNRLEERKKIPAKEVFTFGNMNIGRHTVAV